MRKRESRPVESGIREPSPERAVPPLAPAWQPFTFKGVAAFSRAPIGRVFLVQLIVSLAIAGVLVWFLQTSWFPRILEAVRALPVSGAIEGGVLSTPRDSPEPLAADGFISISVNPGRGMSRGSDSDVRVEFHRTSFSICSLLGCLSLEYPSGYVVQLNQPELEAWWGAWRLTVIVVVVAVTVVILFGNWLLLATCYAVPVWLGAFFKDRQISLAGSWKLASAALLAPALVVGGSVVLYGWSAVDLLRLLLVWVAHVPLGWVYLHFAVRRLPPVPEVAGRASNPFTGPRPKGARRNPFSGRP